MYSVRLFKVHSLNNLWLHSFSKSLSVIHTEPYKDAKLVALIKELMAIIIFCHVYST